MSDKHIRMIIGNRYRDGIGHNWTVHTMIDPTTAPMIMHGLYLCISDPGGHGYFDSNGRFWNQGAPADHSTANLMEDITVSSDLDAAVSVTGLVMEPKQGPQQIDYSGELMPVGQTRDEQFNENYDAVVSGPVAGELSQPVPKPPPTFADLLSHPAPDTAKAIAGTRYGFTYVATLPNSPTPWRIARYNTLLIFANDHHPPMMLDTNGYSPVLVELFNPKGPTP